MSITNQTAAPADKSVDRNFIKSSTKNIGKKTKLNCL